ncbi:hypothetical protein MRX96_055987 [Rhipicephalus microplus]
MTIILSLSVYIRSQMTALVTATKPVDHMDTLEELERALDAGHVAPVVVAGSSKWDILEKASDHPYSLLRKLHSAYKSLSGKQLLVQTMNDCIRLAGRPDRVCYSAVQPRCMVKKTVAGVQPFQEPMTMMLNGIPLRHGFSYLPALRRLLLVIREGSLTRTMNFGCHSEYSSVYQAQRRAHRIHEALLAPSDDRSRYLRRRVPGSPVPQGAPFTS